MTTEKEEQRLVTGDQKRDVTTCQQMRTSFVDRETWLTWCKAIYGLELADIAVAVILDYTTIGGQSVLLDGKGGQLLAGSPPVYLEFRPGEVQKNSRGEPFVPSVDIKELIGGDNSGEA